jgi:putative tricarboxylic transport membrane protein
MKYRDLVSSLFWMAFGALFCVPAWQYGLVGGPGIPGPGCLPFIVGLSLISLSLTIFIPAVKSVKEKTEPEAERFFPEKDSSRKLLVALAALLTYGIVLEPLGYLPTSFLFMVVVLRWIEPQKWRRALIFAVLAAALSYTLFTALKVELPAGLFRI